MNLVDYFQNQEEYDRKSFMVPIENLEYSEHEEGNEVRLTKKTSDPQLNFELKQTGGNIVPVSVHGGNGGVYGMDDGFNRVRELRALGIEKVKCIMSDYSSPSDRLWGMQLDNIYLSFTVASTADIVGTAVQDIKNNYVLGADLTKVTKEQVRKFVEKKLEKKPQHGNRMNSIVRKVMEELPSGVKKYTNYTNKEDAARIFTKINPWGLVVEKPGDVCRDMDGQLWAVFFAGTDTWVRQNGVHSAFNKKGSNPNLKILLVTYDEKVYNSKGDIGSLRNKMLSVAEKENKTMLDRFGSGVKLYDRICSLPQILKGAQVEDHDNLAPGTTKDL